MSDLPPYRPLVGVEIDQGLIAERELREQFDRLEREGFPHHVAVAAIAALAGSVISERHNTSLASAWFYGCALQCARMAAAEFPGTQH